MMRTFLRRAGGVAITALALMVSGNLYGQTPREDFERGVAAMREGRVEESLERLDRYAESTPDAVPYLWQRGIVQYLGGKYQEGRLQFESHRTVNPNDVENATWHFLCVAALDGVEEARKAFLPAPNDSRVPMNELHALYKGTGSVEEVEAAVAKTPEGTSSRQVARFYADLYLGLFAHAQGKKDEAKKFLDASASVPGMSVMGDVAKVCRDRLVSKDTGAPSEKK